MVQRPRPDLRGGCAAMRIPTVTGVKRRNRPPSESRTRGRGRRMDVRASMSATLTPRILMLPGMLVRYGNTFGILYDSTVPNEGFQRFSIAHELGHFFVEGQSLTTFGSTMELIELEPATCSCLQSSRVLLANIGDFCSDYLRMTGPECSRSLRTCSHYLRPTCNHRSVLTLVANEMRRRRRPAPGG